MTTKILRQWLTAIVTATATRPFAKQIRTKHAAAASSKECITPTAIVYKLEQKIKHIKV
jgi:hypothetical protein